MGKYSYLTFSPFSVLLKWSIYNDLGRLFVYLGKREYVQCDGVIEPVQGVVYIQVIKSRREGDIAL